MNEFFILAIDSSISHPHLHHHPSALDDNKWKLQVKDIQFESMRNLHKVQVPNHLSSRGIPSLLVHSPEKVREQRVQKISERMEDHLIDEKRETTFDKGSMDKRKFRSKKVPCNLLPG